MLLTINMPFTLDEEMHHFHSVCVLFVGGLVAPILVDDRQGDKLVLHQHSYEHVPRDI